VTLAPLAAWVGGDPIADPAPDDVVLRYLAAFGPASVADVTAWCRLTGMRAVVERLRPRLRSYRSPRGTELLDVAGATLAEPDVPAPVRLLPEYDNVLLSHADRSRFAGRPGWDVPPPVKGTVLVDGLVRAVWHPVDDGLVVRTFGPLPKRAAASVAAEGRRLLRFLEADGTEVRVEALD
jgi:hypothetical protein